MIKNPKKNNWCFFEYKLVQIKEVREGKISAVTDGMFRTSSMNFNDRCYELNTKINTLNNIFRKFSDRLHDLNMAGLNYPDFARELEKRWCNACDIIDNTSEESINDEDEEKLKLIVSNTEVFVDKICGKAKEVNNISVDGVYLCRR